MPRLWRATVVALSACAGSIVRAPQQIPTDGVVECTDSMAVPIARASVGGLLTAGTLAYIATDPHGSIDSGGIFWAPVLVIAGLDLLYGAAEGAATVRDCRAAKQRGAVVAEAARRRAADRAQAGTEWKRAAAAARADDCATVRELDPEIRELDVEFHDVVFARDVAIARCLRAP
jgi:hypothetical protein